MTIKRNIYKVMVLIALVIIVVVAVLYIRKVPVYSAQTSQCGSGNVTIRKSVFQGDSRADIDRESSKIRIAPNVLCGDVKIVYFKLYIW